MGAVTALGGCQLRVLLAPFLAPWGIHPSVFSWSLNASITVTPRVPLELWMSHKLATKTWPGPARPVKVLRGTAM